MRLKEIKPGMVIHCKNDEEKKALFEEAERLGYRWSGNRWNGDAKLPTDNTVDSGSTVHFYDKNEFTDFKHITWSYVKEGVTEFSDLIMQELTSEELFRICGEICKEYSNKGYNCKSICPFGFHGMSCTVYRAHKFDEVKEICAKWKSDHEKKEPEIETEWFWQGRIFQIKDGCYYQIKEDGTGFYDTGCEYRESAEEYMKDELKEYCKTHEGEFIAVVEHVCRVKAVK